MIDGKLEGRRILLVEDEYFQAREIKTILEQEGAKVLGPTGRAHEVPELLATARIDAAILDINLGAGPSYTTANLLQREGIPFAFLTGYDSESIPPELLAIPRVEKPANQRVLIDLLTDLI